MFRNKLRLLGMSTLVGAGLLASGPASAYNMRLGDVDVKIDTTVSAGLSVRAAKRETALLPEVNGGPVDDRRVVSSAAVASAWDDGVTDPEARALGIYALYGAGTMDKLGAACLDNGSQCSFLAKSGLGTDRLNPLYKDNYDASINGDDGRLNFDQGDIQGAVVKATFDVEASYESLRAFARINAFYDAVLASDHRYERTGLMGGKDQSDMVRHIDLLDAYVAYDGDAFGMPYEVRVGKQVINWGEATFVLGGNSVFSPINVNAIVRPGSEIKEALLPVEAIYGSMSVTDNVTIEAYYGGWDKFQLPTGGTPFASSDVANVGSASNQNIAFIGGAPSGGDNRINCAAEAGDTANGFTATNSASSNTVALAAFAKAAYATAGYTCEGTPAVDYRYALGSNGDLTAEQERIEGPGGYYFKVANHDDEEGDNYGLAVRYYAANLNSTEFGFYYQNYTSRIPYVSYWTDTPSLGFQTMGNTTDLASRLLGAGGCGQAIAAIAVGEDTTAGTNTDFAGMKINDPYGLFGSAFDTFNGSSAKDLQHAMELVCDNTRKMSQAVPQAYNVTLTGEMRPVVALNMGLKLAYPEDIEVWGFSFNTTIAGWGVQGEITHRPDMPLQIDTDSLAIGTLVNGCGLANYGNGGGAVLSAFGYKQADGSAWGSINDYVAFDNLTTRQGLTGCDGTGYQEIDGFYYTEVNNFDIGTTATYTRSNPLVAALGADMLVLLTEIAGTYAPDIEDKTFTTKTTLDGREVETVVSTLGADTVLRGASHCTSGTDLPLGGLFNLDNRPGNLCRPTSVAYGGVMLLRLDYNNAFGTAWSLSPQLVVSEGIRGRSPKPAGGWTENQGSASLSMTANYQDVSVGVGYTSYYGDVLYNSNIDRDFFSLNLKYGF